METKLPHLIVADFKQSAFTTGKTPQLPLPPRPERDQNEHSSYLKRQLEQAWAEAENDKVVYHTDRNGIYLEFKGEEGYKLVTKSLERRSKDFEKCVRLLNIRSEKHERAEGVAETTYATIYVPNCKKDVFFNLIEKYAAEVDSKSEKPKNAALIESISDIRKALEIESFWQDNKSLIPAEVPEWCEVWLNSDQDEAVQRFETLLRQQQINFKADALVFPERIVKIVHANRSQLETISRLSDDIAEYRRAKKTAAFWLEKDNRQQAEWIKTILDRLRIARDSDVAVCILDTGVNYLHPLINPILKQEDCQSVNPSWGTHDHHKHGTLMAGVTGYGNLLEILSHDELILLRHCLESVKILPPTGTTEPELWGYVTAQGVYKAEIQSPDKKRITCMAVTSDDTRDRGRPSSWSAELDQLCSGSEDDLRRLFIVCAGNASSTCHGSYTDANLSDSIHDPAQSWNALTVGAYTQLDEINDPKLSGYEPIAPFKGLSPFSTTSLTWDDMWPNKPEIVMEGGNLAKDSTGFITECDDLSLMSTFYDPQRAHFYPFNMTSAAAAQAAWFAAQIQASYPNYWPETIRGLMVHSAEWTDMLKKQFLENESKTSYKRLLRICGYGVPNLEKAIYSASNSLTLIAQAELQPFDEKESDSGHRTKDMHLYELPWPKEVLESLSDSVKVEMSITLSYFIEPGPGEIGWQDRYRYASHGLRFDLNSPTESKNQFLRRINAAERDDDNGHPGTSSASGHWLLGQARDKGSIHSDKWSGTAAELAASNMIAVYPVIGWWRERAHLGKWNRKTRYSLIVSINTPERNIDIYTPVAIKLGVRIPVEIKI